ncbi:sigma-70 region 4 domain-containing protein [Salinisphaera sp. G21_0]|nr:sigma-70 region 4 domain-containing protein [Salinisphaera sp. G21_0]
MRKLREIFRLRFECQLSTRQISRSTRVSVGAVNKYLNRFEAVGLSWPQGKIMKPRILRGLQTDIECSWRPFSASASDQL